MDEFPLFEVTADDGPSLAVSQASHVYDELPKNHIRLLRILPGDPTSEVCCEIGQYVLDEQIEYTALSYTWGAEPAEHAIRLNGKRIYVRKNLWRFLRQARRMDRRLSGLLWIDALSIDQSNYDERSSQVILMPGIYGRAVKVLTWLGPAYGGSDKAMHELSKPMSYWLANGRYLEIWSKPLGPFICGLCVRPYWTRLWIFQELALGRHVELMCGDKIIPLDALQAFLLEMERSIVLPRVREKFEYRTAVTSPAISILRHIARQDSQSTLWNLMTATHHLRCSEARDNVYALLGVTNAGHEGIHADYNIPLPMLLNTVLANEHRLRPPRSLKKVQEQCRQLTTFLRVEPASIFELVSPGGVLPIPQDSDMISFRLGPSNSRTTLWWASFYGHSAVQRLLFTEAVIGVDDFLRAASDRNANVVRLLLKSGFANVNAQSADGQTASHIAARYGDEEIVKALLEMPGLLPECRDHYGRTAIEVAAKNGHVAVVKLLLESITNHDATLYCERALYAASSHGQTAVVDSLLSSGRIHGNMGGIIARVVELQRKLRRKKSVVGEGDLTSQT